MAAPPRGNTGHGCYFVTASTSQKRSLFQSDRMATLFLEVLLHYRAQDKYLLHEFVLMPDHNRDCWESQACGPSVWTSNVAPPLQVSNTETLIG
jgi:REP element-mobilizing transposase RayT